MEDQAKFIKSTNNYQFILFGFVLNPSQRLLFLILSLIGIFMLPLILAVEIFIDLFATIFIQLPSYFRLPEEYHFDFWFYSFFSPHFSKIFTDAILLYLSIYTLKRILKPNISGEICKNQFSSQEKIVNWLGFKLSHAQSIFIFSLSLIGIILSVQFYFGDAIWFFFDLFRIPIDSNRIISDLRLSDIMRFVICAIFIILCLYSLIITRRGKVLTTSKKIIKNNSLIVYIISLIVLLFSLIRLSFHLFLFTNLAYIFGITPITSTSYQINDFLKIIVISVICLILMSSSYFFKESNTNKVNQKLETYWLSIKLTPQRVIILLSFAILGLVIFIQLFWSFLLVSGLNIGYPGNIMMIIVISFIFFCYYPINKILIENRLTNSIKLIENPEKIIVNWFKFSLKRLDSIVFLSVSSGFIVFYIFNMVGLNASISQWISDVLYHNYSIHFSEVIGIPIMVAIMTIIMAINVYTIKKTLHSIKTL